MSTLPNRPNTRAGRCAVVAAAVVFAASCVAPALASVRMGVDIGANLSSLRYGPLDAFPAFASGWDPGWRTSITGGASLEFPFRRRVSVVTGLRYVQQGNRVKLDFPGPPRLTGEFRIAQHYIAVPVLLAFRPIPLRRFFVAAGPEGALLLNGKLLTDYSSPPAQPSSSDDITLRLNQANVWLAAETGLEFPVGKHFGAVTLRYTHGLVDAEKKDDWAIPWKTRGFEGLVGMRW